jgi:hypothetical protein
VKFTEKATLLREQITKITLDILENKNKLAACPGPHDFVQEANQPLMFTCSRCNGRLDSYAHGWYMEGRSHERAIK